MERCQMQLYKGAWLFVLVSVAAGLGEHLWAVRPLRQVYRGHLLVTMGELVLSDVLTPVF